MEEDHEQIHVARRDDRRGLDGGRGAGRNLSAVCAQTSRCKGLWHDRLWRQPRRLWLQRWRYIRQRTGLGIEAGSTIRTRLGLSTQYVSIKCISASRKIKKMVTKVGRMRAAIVIDTSRNS